MKIRNLSGLMLIFLQTSTENVFKVLLLFKDIMISAADALVAIAVSGIWSHSHCSYSIKLLKPIIGYILKSWWPTQSWFDSVFIHSAYEPHKSFMRRCNLYFQFYCYLSNQNIVPIRVPTDFVMRDTFVAKKNLKKRALLNYVEHLFKMWKNSCTLWIYFV